VSKCVAVIPARGGSQRIPLKNIRLFHGKPIIAYSINAAIDSKLFDRVIVSTDSEEIAAVARQYGAEIHWRISPTKSGYDLDWDNLGTQEVMRFVLEDLYQENPASVNGWIACCLYATAPMLLPRTLIESKAMLEKGDSHYVVPVATWLRDPGQFYMGQFAAFMNEIPLMHAKIKMIPENTECDINTMDDWSRAEEMFAKLHEEKT
jgi:pseudaminic acid cytidylyltransferase